MRFVLVFHCLGDLRMLLLYYRAAVILFFFFQAEDGIRDIGVTGVQTCALPIYPVLNDRQFRVWRAYAVRAWPTLVAIDPRGYVVGTHAGEFTAGAIEPFVEATLARAREAGVLTDEPLHLAVGDPEPPRRPSLLRYPGKVAIDDPRSTAARIAIADSGNHRVLVGRLEAGGRHARVEQIFGGTRGFADGRGADARFDSPQGMCFAGDHLLYVADAEAHSVREIDLASGDVRTIAGTGEQLRTREDMRAGALSSPWDVTLVGDTLWVAMAGIHQIWGLELGGRGTWSEVRGAREGSAAATHHG